MPTANHPEDLLVARDVEHQVRLQWGESFRLHARIGLGLILAGDICYGVANIVAQPPRFAPMAFLQLVHAGVLAGGFWYLRKPRSWTNLQGMGLGQAAYACLSTALVGGLAERTVSTAFTAVTLAFLSPSFLPWGVGAQATLAAAGMGAIFLNSMIVTGRLFAPASVYALIGTTLALICSIFMAAALERARLAVASQELKRSRAERDVRELNVELEARIEARTSQLESALNELQSFTYTVSHDLRSPLRGINGLARLLVEEASTSLDEEHRELLERICAATRRMDAMIDALLALGRVAQTTLGNDDIDLTAVARSVAADLAAADPERRVEIHIQEGVTGRGDPALIGMVLANLLQNAWKYTRGVEHPMIEVGTGSGERGNFYFVRDNGRGFEMAYVDSIFKPFQRLEGQQTGEEAIEGTGIGLTTVQRIVRRHGGDIWVHSAPGKGATFYFSLGRSSEPRKTG